MSSAVQSKENGILAKIERMNGFFGGWHSLLRGRNGRNKKLKKENKMARFAREFRGRLMLEPLEERIVPAAVSIASGEFFAFDAVGGIGVIGFFSPDAGANPLHIDYTSAAGVDTINEIGIQGDGSTETAGYFILTNFGLNQVANGALIFNDVDTG